MVKYPRRQSLSVSDYSALAARRFLQYRLRKRQESLERRAAGLAVAVFERAVPAFQQAGLVKRRNVEKVDVE